MSRDPNGVYSLPPSYFVQTGDTILPVQHNPVFESVANALTNSIDRDGRTVMTGNLQMGGNKVTNVAPGINDGDAVNVLQLRDRVDAVADFATVADMLADNNQRIGYAGSGARVIVVPGQIITAQGFRYEVAASDAMDFHIETAGGVKLNVQITNGHAHLLSFGASETASAADNQVALEKWISSSVHAGAVLTAAPVRIDFASTLTLPGNQIVHWDGLELVKQFDGDGVVFAGGPAVIYSHGRLMVEKGAGGSGPAGSEELPGNTTAGTNPADVGIVLCNRMINFGELVSWYNQGSGIELRSDAGNMNSAHFGFLRSQFNGRYGIEGTGTRDDISLVSIRARIYGNWQSGLYLPAGFHARSWREVFVTAESNGVNGVSPEIYIGEAYDDGTWVLYGENQQNAAADVPEILIGPNSRYISVVNLRPNRYVNNSTRPWSIKSDWKANLLGRTPVADFYRAGSVRVDNPNDYIEIPFYGASETLLQSIRVLGDGSVDFVFQGGANNRRIRLHTSGDIETVRGGRGLIAKALNGQRYMLTPPNAGGIATWVAI